MAAGAAIMPKNDETRMPTLFAQLDIDTPKLLARRRVHPANSVVLTLFLRICVILHCFVIGLQVDAVRSPHLEDFLGYVALELFFCVVFIGDAGARIHQLGWDYFLDPWNTFDFVLVIWTSMDLLITLDSNGEDHMLLGSTMRLCRLLSLTRSIKGLRQFVRLWTLLTVLLESLRTLFWIAVIFIFFNYIFAVALTSLMILDTELELWSFLSQYCGSVGKSMLTIVQVVTFDGWMEDIGRPVARANPMALFVLIGAIICCYLSVLHILAGVIITKCLSLTKDNREDVSKFLEESEEIIIESFQDDFDNFETSDARDELRYNEFVELLNNESCREKLNLLGIHLSEAQDLFDIMDADRSGLLSVEEFVDGIRNVKGTAKGCDLVSLISSARKSALELQRHCLRVNQLTKQVDVLQARAEAVGRRLTGELRDRTVAAQRTVDVWKHAHERQEIIAWMDIDRSMTYPDKGKPPKQRRGI